MDMMSTKVIVGDKTVGDIIAEICDDTGLDTDDYFIFGVILRDGVLTVNSLLPYDNNPYTIREALLALFDQERETKYVQAPIDLWLSVFHPMLLSLVARHFGTYEKLIQSFDEQLSILYETVLVLYRKNYYLHRHLINRAYINSLNQACRKIKNFQDSESLEDIKVSDGGEMLALSDMLEDVDSTMWAESCIHYTLDDYWEDKLSELKAAMLKDMSPLAYERILMQLEMKCVDTATSRILCKYRQMFNPTYTPRPNTKTRRNK